MATKTVITCDFCGTEKQETNGWFRTTISEDGMFFAWHSGKPPAPGPYLDVCGQECATKAFGRWLSHGTLEEQS